VAAGAGGWVAAEAGGWVAAGAWVVAVGPQLTSTMLKIVSTANMAKVDLRMFFSFTIDRSLGLNNFVTGE